MDMNIWYNIEINFEYLSDNIYSVSLGNHVRYLALSKILCKSKNNKTKYGLRCKPYFCL